MSELGIPGISGATEIGSTAATAIHRAVDTATGRAVEVTVLLRDATPEVRARFDYDQARLTELADHPNLVTVLRHGYTADNRPFVVRAPVQGGSMADKVGSGLDGPGVLALGIRVAGALESAHRRDVVHGDLRPEDVKIDARGEPEVADFGVAMVTGIGPDRATDAQGLAHAAPEQLQTHMPTPASDVYALGSVLYALLAGGPAFVRPGDASVAAVGARILAEAPADLRPNGVPAAVVDAIERAMQKDPAARWITAEAFGLALQQAEITLGLPITPMTVLGPDRPVSRPVVDHGDEPAPPPAPPPPKRSNRVPAAIGAVALVAVVAVGAVVLLGGDDDGEGGRGGRVTVTRPERVSFDLVPAADESGSIQLEVLEAWDQVDGAPLVEGDITLPDVVAATDSDAFLSPEGFAVSGIEVTVVPEGVDDAAALLDARVSGRGLDGNCTTDLPPQRAAVGGFEGLLQRFEGCAGNALVVFAGVAGGQGLLAEVHLVEAEDEAALDDVLDSIEVS